MTFLTFLIVALLACSFFFNLAEMAYLNIDRADYAAFQQNDPEGAGLITRIVSAPARLFTTLLIGIHASLSTANILISHLLISTSLSVRQRELILLGYAILVILFAEAIPQVLGIRGSRFLWRGLARPIQFFVFILTPFTLSVEFLFRRLHRDAPASHLDRESWRSEDLLRLASSAPGTVSSAISRFITAKNRPLSTLIRPAAQTVSIGEGDSLQSVLRKFSSSGLSRLPYWTTGPTRFFAYLHIKDALGLLAEDEQDWKSALHPLPVFLTTTSVLKAFLSLRALRAHIAAVSSPEGKIAGIVTMDDLLNFFIGDLPAPTADLEPAPFAVTR
jgi:CBS domain containing-hemolysin-like protein